MLVSPSVKPTVREASSVVKVKRQIFESDEIRSIHLISCFLVPGGSEQGDELGKDDGQ